MLEEGQSVILGANYQSGNRILFSENKAIRLIILDVDRKKFAEQLSCSCVLLHYFLCLTFL